MSRKKCKPRHGLRPGGGRVEGASLDRVLLRRLARLAQAEGKPGRPRNENGLRYAEVVPVLARNGGRVLDRPLKQILADEE